MLVQVITESSQHLMRIPVSVRGFPQLAYKAVEDPANGLHLFLRLLVSARAGHL